MSEFVTFTPGEYYDWEQPYVQDRLDIAAGRKQPEMPKLPAGMNLFAGPKPFTEAEILEYNRKWNPYDPLYNDPDYARKHGFPSVPAMSGFAQPRGGMMMGFPKNIADKFYYTHDGGSFEIRDRIFAGDLLTPGKTTIDFRDITVPGSRVRAWYMGGTGESLRDGKVVLTGGMSTRDCYSKFSDDTPTPSFSENMSEWYDYFPAAHYTTDEEWAYIRELWQKEEIRGAEPLYWEDVSVGYEAPRTCTGPITYMNMIYWYGGSALSREQLMNPGNLETMYRDHYGNYLFETSIHLGNRNHPKGRMVWYNDTGAKAIYRTITNFIGDRGRVSKFSWRFFPFFRELQGPTDAAEMFNKVPGMEGRDCERHGSEGDTCIGRAVVTDKYVNDRGEHCIEIALWAETLDGEIVQACASEAVLPSRGEPL